MKVNMGRCVCYLFALSVVNLEMHITYNLGD